jgi:hypothetical protein
MKEEHVAVIAQAAPDRVLEVVLLDDKTVELRQLAYDGRVGWHRLGAVELDTSACRDLAAALAKADELRDTATKRVPAKIISLVDRGRQSGVG